MKQYMLRQIPGYDMLMLPPFDTRREEADNSMDHLVYRCRITSNELILTIDPLDLFRTWYACNGIQDI